MKADAPEQLDLIRPLATNFEYFCKVVLRQKIGRMHKEWIAEAMNKEKHLCVESARGHFKTTILSIDFPLWIMFNQKESKTFVILSASLEQSTEIMQNLKRNIEDNPFLREVLYPDNIHSTKWSETQIRTKNGHRVLCIPFGDAARGKHPDYCICDDVLKAEVQTDVEDAKRIFYGVIYPTVQAKRGKIIVVGTPVSFVDLLADLSTKPNFTFIKYPAIITDTSGNWVSPQFPEHFDLAQLRSVQETMPAHLWAREYMCNPVSGETSVFPPEVIKKCLMAYPAAQSLCAASKETTRYMGGDVAVSMGKGADWSVYTTLERAGSGPLLVKDIVRRHISTEENISLVVSLNEIHRPSRIYVEKTGVGWGVAEGCRKHPVIGSIVTMFDTKAASKEKMLSRLEVYMRNGKLLIPQNDLLIQELSQFAYKKGKDGRWDYESLGEHDDMVMSLALALEAASATSRASLVFV